MLTHFTMPGYGMPNFRRNGELMAKHGIYDLRQHHEDVVLPSDHTRRHRPDAICPPGTGAPLGGASRNKLTITIFRYFPYGSPESLDNSL